MSAGSVCPRSAAVQSAPINQGVPTVKTLTLFLAAPGAWLVLITWTLVARTDEQPGKVAFPTFRTQEIDKGLGVCYAVLLVDINGDGKKDIVVVNPNRVVWYENPTWKRRTIVEGTTIPDNECIDAFDIDGDGQVDLALGS